LLLPSEAAEECWLLIGNSRWHWAVRRDDRLHCWSESPAGTGDHLLQTRLPGLRGWAAVGPVPDDAPLDPSRRLHTADVPLASLPGWLGVDRALVAWQAWRLGGGAALVADAGTALSFTRVDGTGSFAGGRIQAGRALQLRSLAAATSQLPEVYRLPEDGEAVPLDSWPHATAEAMEQGVRLGMVASVAAAWHDLRRSDPGCRLWITGGDGAWLAAALGVPCRPDLALEALVTLSPDRDRPGWCRPSSPP
jgi:type III pantothenate kinase